MKLRRFSTALVATALFTGIAGGIAGGAIPPGKGGSPHPTGPPSLYVAASGGTDGTNTCQSVAAPCATVAYAQSVAQTGATINLGAGTYAAPIAISQSVNIAGAGSIGVHATVIEPSTTVSDSDSDSAQVQAAIVDVTNHATANISGVDIEGSAASPTFDNTGCASADLVGVYFHDASGALTNVKVNGIEYEESLFGCQLGLAIYVTNDPASTTSAQVSFSGVTVTNYDKNGITCDDAKTTCSITSSTVTGIGATSLTAQNGIQIAYGAAGTISNATVSGDSYTGGTYTAAGILLYDAARTSISGSHVSLSDEDIVGAADSDAVAGNWTVSGNTVTGATNDTSLGDPGYGIPSADGFGDGISFYDTTSVNKTTVAGNTATGNSEYGIALYGSSGVTVQQNHANSNYDGFFSDTGSGGNTFLQNSATGNTHEAYEDASSGTKSAHTANSWINNSCTPRHQSAPSGLC